MGGKRTLQRKNTPRVPIRYFKIAKLICQKLENSKEKRRVGRRPTSNRLWIIKNRKLNIERKNRRAKRRSPQIKKEKHNNSLNINTYKGKIGLRVKKERPLER